MVIPNLWEHNIMVLSGINFGKYRLSDPMLVPLHGHSTFISVLVGSKGKEY